MVSLDLIVLELFIPLDIKRFDFDYFLVVFVGLFSELQPLELRLFKFSMSLCDPLQFLLLQLLLELFVLLVLLQCICFHFFQDGESALAFSPLSLLFLLSESSEHLFYGVIGHSVW